MDTWGALESLNRMMLCGLITAFPHAMIQRAWPLGHPAMTALACTFEKFFARAAASLPEDCWGLGLKRSLSTQKTLGELRHLLQWGAHAAHHVDAAVGRVAVAGGELVERRDVPVAVLVFALAGEEDLLAGLPLQLVDIRLVDIELALEPPGLVGGFEHHQDPFPLRQPVAELAAAKFVDPGS